MRPVVIFFSVFFTVYAALSTYVFFHGLQAIPDTSGLRTGYIVLFVFLSLSYIVGEILESRGESWVSDILVRVGAYWMAIFAYLIIATVLVDLLRLADHFFPYLPSVFLTDPINARFITLLVLVGGILLTVAAGAINSRYPRLKPMSFTIDKPLPGHDSLRVVTLSDIHLGTIIRRKNLEEMVAKINGCNPDIVLLAGDIVDGNPAPCIHQNVGEVFDQIKSKYGVFAITGNHEYIGKAEVSCKYLSEHGITMIRDSSVEVAGLTIVGREDRSAKQFGGAGRKSLEELMANVDRTKPIFLMDHQPFRLEEAEDQGVDFQLSGHTHHAQLWPLSYITKRMYEVSWGYKQKGNTHVYVSCGTGTWGPPVRVGSTPEIMDMTIRFTNN